LAELTGTYPAAPEMKLEPSGGGIELPIENPQINKRGWLRAAFWVHEKSRTMFFVDLFWKKTNQLTTANVHRINHRIRQLKSQLGKGSSPWKSGQ